MRCSAITASAGLLLGLLLLPNLHAQQAPPPRSTTNAAPNPGVPADQAPAPASAESAVPTTAATTPPLQAPKEATQKISDLVRAGRYPEAEKLVEGLLIAFPDDERLIKAKALIDQLLASATPTSPAAVTNPALGANAETLTGMDRVDYSALIELARQAQQTPDLDEQTKLLKQFMAQSTAFLQQHSDLLLLWQLRGASAISLNDPAAGYEAGQELLSAGAADSKDPALQNLLAKLRNKDWLSKQGMENAQEFNRLMSLNPRLTYGPWSTGHGFNVLMKTTLTLTITGFGDMREPVSIRMENASPKTCRVEAGTVGVISITSKDIAGGTYTTARKATLTSMKSYAVPCTVNVSVLDKTGKPIKTVTITNGY